MTGISELAAGFIIIAVSTNLPEFSVAVFSTYTKNVELTIGDVFGSNVTNTALTVAIFLLLSPVRRLDKKTAKGVFPLLIAAVIPLLLLLLKQGDKLTGILLLGVFALFVYQTFKTHKRESRATLGSGSHYRPLFFFLLGMTLVIVSARMVVASASLIAESTGIEQSVIGGTIIWERLYQN